ncbi:MAG: hypothetical protein AB8I08_13665 [Sandaracinaceae bacterium]
MAATAERRCEGAVSAAVRRVTLLAGLAALMSLAACAPSADDPRARTETWEPASGAFRVHYLDPPWEVTAASDEELFLRIRSTRMLAAESDAGPGKFELVVSTVRGEPSVLANGEANALRREGFGIEAGPRAIANLDGVEGTEVVAFLDAVVPRWRRVAFFPLGPGSSVRFAFESDPTLDHPEVDAMLLQVEIGAPE